MAQRRAGSSLSAAERAIGRRLIDEIDRFNVETTGIEDFGDVLVTETGDDGQLLGGVYGWSWGGTCWLHALWVRADARGERVGSRLLQAAEEIARERRCTQMALDTHTFQAPGLYARHGFEVVGRAAPRPAWPDDHPIRTSAPLPPERRLGR